MLVLSLLTPLGSLEKKVRYIGINNYLSDCHEISVATDDLIVYLNYLRSCRKLRRLLYARP